MTEQPTELQPRSLAECSSRLQALRSNVHELIREQGGGAELELVLLNIWAELAALEGVVLELVSRVEAIEAS